MLNAVVASPMLSESEPFFSKGPCENCDTELGGLRYDIIYKEKINGPVHEATVCADCYCKLCS